MAFISFKIKDNKGMFDNEGKPVMVNGKQIPARTINFSTEISSIRNISVKMPIGFALAIQAKLHARMIENKPFTISYPSFFFFLHHTRFSRVSHEIQRQELCAMGLRCGTYGTL